MAAILTDRAIKLIREQGKFADGRIEGIVAFRPTKIVNKQAVMVEALISDPESPSDPLVIIGPFSLAIGEQITLPDWVVSVEYQLPPSIPAVESKEEFGTPGIVQSDPP